MPLYFAKNRDVFWSLAKTKIDPKMGGHVRFIGSVRSCNNNKSVKELFYEAFVPMAEQQFKKLEDEARTRFLVQDIIAIHRLDTVLPGEEAVLIEVSAEHRKEAFLAARFLIDELKRTVPIWKKEIYVDGSAQWDKGLCQCAPKEPSLVFENVFKALSARDFDIEKIKKSRVLVVGAGGLGCPLAYNLAALSILKLDIIDGDKVEEKNLARQFMFTNSDVGMNKAALVQNFIAQRFGMVINAHEVFLDETNIRSYKDYDLIVEASDSLVTKSLVAKFARAQKIPCLITSVYQMEGEIVWFDPKASGGCFSCYRPPFERAVRCEEGGVLTHACSMVAALATSEILNFLTNKSSSHNRMILIDSYGSHKSLDLSADPHCQVCAANKCESLKVLK